jgi:hypothetical protein
MSHSGQFSMQRFLCADCKKVKQAVERDGSIRLECGHIRDAGLLPSLPGTLSVEAIAAARNAADRKRLAELFPVDTFNERTSRRRGWVDCVEEN